MQTILTSHSSWKVIGGEFSDPDELSESAKGWNLDFRQLECGRFHSRLQFLLGQNLMLTSCQLGRRVEQLGEPPPGMLTFGIPMKDEMRLRWRGVECDGRCIMLFRPGTELNTVSDSKFSVTTVSVPADRFFSATEAAGKRPEDVLGQGTDVRLYSDSSRHRLRNAATRLMGFSLFPDLPSSSEFGELERELVECIVEAWLETRPLSHRPIPHIRQRALKNALSFIRDHADEPITLGQLEQTTGASTRTLRYAFQEAYGVSPKTYLQAFRLHQVRKRLVELRKDESPISRAANEWGFWHMGQFAADYRKLFGELPSETLIRRQEVS